MTETCQAAGCRVRWQRGRLTAERHSLQPAAASKATPGFDVIDYGQEDYVFGNKEKDARHWNSYLLEIFEEHAEVLEPLFNGNE